MPKRPVGRTVDAGYQLAFQQFFAVLGGIRVPDLVVIVIIAALAIAMVPGFIHGAGGNMFPTAEIPGLIGLGVLLALSGLVGRAVAGGGRAIVPSEPGEATAPPAETSPT